MSRRFQSSAPPHCVSPRAYTDAGLRRHHYGPIQPMDELNLRADLRHALWVFPLVAVVVVGLAAVMP